MARPISGIRRGPKKMSTMTAMMRISEKPKLPKLMASLPPTGRPRQLVLRALAISSP